MTTWQEIYHRLDPTQPLEANDERLDRDLYLNDFFRSVRTQVLINKEKNYKLLFSGHNGCGKSTFLNLLADDKEIKADFHLVKYSIKEIVDPNLADYIDLLLSVAVQVINSLPEGWTETAGRLTEKATSLAQQLQGTIQRITVEDQTTEAKAGGGIESGVALLDFLKTKFFLKFQYEEKTREEVRRQYTTKITDFITLINDILTEAEVYLNKKILILIDDTDKLPPEKGLKIFFDNGHHLASPRANILFVIDVSLSTSSQYRAISAKFNGEEFFPAVKIRERDSRETDRTKRNVAILQELVSKRVPPELIDGPVLKMAIDYSGGVVRELIRILQQAILNATGRIREDNIEYARLKIANSFNLYGRHTKILNSILNDPDWLAREEAKDDEPTVLELLYMPAIFQYRNGDEKWYRPNPILIKYLERLYPRETPLFK
ncbi:MAG: P-loop NTPase fold protein [Thermodesulfovibrionales bacterium]|jgi:energy-coupling factor transporter ATP-binding protein EcfA2